MIEVKRLNYIRNNQKKLCADIYSGFNDALVEGETNVALKGKRIIFPLSFIGGARYLLQNYHDAR